MASRAVPRPQPRQPAWPGLLLTASDDTLQAIAAERPMNDCRSDEASLHDRSALQDSPGRNSKIAWWAARVAGEKAPLVSTRIFGDQQVQWAASKRLSGMLTGLLWMSCVSTKSLSTAYRSPVPLADMAGRTSEKDGSGTGRCSRRAVRPTRATTPRATALPRGEPHRRGVR